MNISKLLLGSIIIGLTFINTSCKKNCETCYFIEEDLNGNVINSTDLGEFCGNDIKQQESQTFVSVTGPTRVECRE